MKHKTKYYLLLILASLLLGINASAQQSTAKPKYRVWVKGQHPTVRVQGYLMNMSDSTITINRRNWPQNSAGPFEIPVEQVKWLKYRHKRNIPLGVGIGVVLGAIGGYGLGMLEGDDRLCSGLLCFSLKKEYKGLKYSLIAVPILGTLGGIIGSSRAKVLLGGKREEYARQRAKLERIKAGH